MSELPRLRTETIYGFKPGLLRQKLTVRAGQLAVANGNTLREPADLNRPLQVTAGLDRTDIAAFLSLVPREEAADAGSLSVGYLVTRVNVADGSGSIVPGDICEANPSTWLPPAALLPWVRLHRLGHTFDTFNLPGLADYVAQTIQVLDSQT